MPFLSPEDPACSSDGTQLLRAVQVRALGAAVQAEVSIPRAEGQSCGTKLELNVDSHSQDSADLKPKPPEERPEDIVVLTFLKSWGFFQNAKVSQTHVGWEGGGVGNTQDKDRRKPPYNATTLLTFFHLFPFFG